MRKIIFVALLTAAPLFTLGSTPAAAFGCDWFGFGYSSAYAPRAYSYTPAPRTYSYAPARRYYGSRAYYGGALYRPRVTRAYYGRAVYQPGVTRAYGYRAARRGVRRVR